MKTIRDADEFINQEIPQSDRILLPKQFQAAYKTVKGLTKATPFLKCPPAMMAQGHLITWAVDFALWQLIESGEWHVFDYEWRHYTKPTGQYLRIYTKNAVVTVSQATDTYEQPRKAAFRDNAAYNNQPSLFLLPGEKDFSTSDNKPHLLLVHGYQSLKFVHIAMPNPEKQPAWLGITKNLLHEIRDVSSDASPIEGPDSIEQLTIKEHLKKKIHDHGV